MIDTLFTKGFSDIADKRKYTPTEKAVFVGGAVAGGFLEVKLGGITCGLAGAFTGAVLAETLIDINKWATNPNYGLSLELDDKNPYRLQPEPIRGLE